MKKYITSSAKQTENLAQKIASRFSNGEVAGLVGELGAGKTQFVKGLAKYFKIKNPITSPTFVLLKPYAVKSKNIKQLVHIDCYRLDRLEELQTIGLEEFLSNPQNLVVIEWADKIKSILPKDTIWIKFKLGSKNNQRIIEIK